MKRTVIVKKRICPRCGFSGGVYNFSPSIEISTGDFRIFHTYSKMNGPLFCNQCKRKHLLKIATLKKLTPEQILFLEEKIKKREKFYS
jgi:hypothetical protein